MGLFREDLMREPAIRAPLEAGGHETPIQRRSEPWTGSLEAGATAPWLAALYTLPLM